VEQTCRKLEECITSACGTKGTEKTGRFYLHT